LGAVLVGRGELMYVLMYSCYHALFLPRCGFFDFSFTIDSDPIIYSKSLILFSTGYPGSAFDLKLLSTSTGFDLPYILRPSRPPYFVALGLVVQRACEQQVDQARKGVRAGLSPPIRRDLVAADESRLIVVAVAYSSISFDLG
jgi:hypothetical protein